MKEYIMCVRRFSSGKEEKGNSWKSTKLISMLMMVDSPEKEKKKEEC